MNQAIAELAQHPQWVAHTSSKVPIGGRGKAASSTDSSTWMTLEDAKMVRAQHGLAGVGFVMTDRDAYVGIDLDNAVDDDDFIKPWADEIVRELCSYTEVSPSGKGLHIWIKGSLPPGPRRIKLGDGLLEVYDSGRYFTVTGRHVPNTPDHIVSAKWVGQWYAERFPPPPASSGGELDDSLFEAVGVDEWIHDALNAISASDYDVWLHVGMALKDHFGESALTIWNDWSKTASNYGGEREIQNRWRSFKSGGITIRTLVKYAREGGFEPPPVRVVNVLPNVDWEGWARSLSDGVFSDAGMSAGGQDFERRFFDMADIAEMPAEYLPDIISPGVLGAGDIMLLFGPPKSMKSMVVLDWCRAWCQGESWHGLKPFRALKIAYVQFEVKLDQVKRRVHAMQLGEHEIEAMRSHCFITDRFVTSFVDASVIDELARDIVGCFDGPPDLVVVDPLANVFTGDNENDNAQMSTFVKQVKYLRGKCGDETAIILVHHTNKSDRRARQSDPFVSLRGASSLRGAYDAGIFVDRLSDDGTGEIMMKFELRNGPPIDKKSLRYESGKFVEATSEEVRNEVADWAKDLGDTRNEAQALEHMLEAINMSMRFNEPLSKEQWRVRSKRPDWAHQLFERLNITKPDARIEKLAESGLVRKDENSRWVVTSPVTTQASQHGHNTACDEFNPLKDNEEQPSQGDLRHNTTCDV